MPTSVTLQGYPGLIGYFKRVAGFQSSPEFKAMLRRAGEVIADDFHMRLITGTTAGGAPVPDKAGIRARREGKYRGLDGGPQAPQGRGSRASRGYRWAWKSSGNLHTYVDRIDGPAWITARVRRYGYAGGLSPQGRASLNAVLRADMLRILRSGPSR